MLSSSTGRISVAREDDRHKDLDWQVVAVELQVGVRESNHGRGVCYCCEGRLQQEDLQVVPLGCNILEDHRKECEGYVYHLDSNSCSTCCDLIQGHGRTNTVPVGVIRAFGVAHNH